MSLSQPVSSKETVPDWGAAPSIDIAQPAASNPERDLTLADMVSIRELHEPRQSPDGRGVAFFVKQAFRPCDCYRTALYWQSSTPGSHAEKLTEAEHMTNLQWSSDGDFLTYLSSEGGPVQLWRMTLKTRHSDPVFVHSPGGDRAFAGLTGRSQDRPPPGVLDYRWSPDGRRMAFTTDAPADRSIADANLTKGFRYDDKTMSAWDLSAGDWAMGSRSKQLWIYTVREKRARLVWTGPSEWSTRISAVVWSPSGRRLALLYSRSTGAESDGLAIVDCATNEISELGSPGKAMSYAAGAAWSRDEQRLAYMVRSETSASYSVDAVNLQDGARQQLTGAIYPGHTPWFFWDADRRKIYFVSEGLGRDRRPTGLYAISDTGGDASRLTTMTDRVSDCGAVVGDGVACVHEAPSMPPRAALVSVVDGSTKDMADVNPEMAAVRLGVVRELHWSNEYGDPTNGYLIMPDRDRPAGRVPLVVMGYAYSGEFVTYAGSSTTTYPARAFARDGIAVLLFNAPRFSDWTGMDFAKGSRAVGYGPLSSIRSIVAQLDGEGLIDSQRVGMMGHSMAGFWTQFAISHTNMFKVVEMHNGGTLSEPGTYWESGSRQVRELQMHIMGGPPYGDTLSNYQEFSMTLNAGRIRTPILMEYSALEAPSAMEYYEAVQYYQVPVEFFIYPGDGHVTERPRHRFISLQRNLEWFEFWLLGKESGDPSAIDQYDRWHQFRDHAGSVAGRANSIAPPATN